MIIFLFDWHYSTFKGSKIKQIFTVFIKNIIDKVDETNLYIYSII